MGEDYSNWWYWGDPKKSQDIDEFPKLLSFLEEKYKKKLQKNILPDTMSFVKDMPETNFDHIANIFTELNSNQVVTDPIERLKHSLGKSYHDLIRIYCNEKIFTPDFILFPNTENDIRYILSVCIASNIKVFTVAGGSNVTGAFNINEKYVQCCALNLSRMNQMLSFDEVSLTAEFQTGISGPQIENELNSRGFTLGHFPQSFEFSTLGGWIATRSAGQESGKYGKIEDMILQLRVVCPDCSIFNLDFPHHAAGPDYHHVFVGSEGGFGIITSARMKIHKLPNKRKWKSIIFSSFSQGSEFIREMVQMGVKPTVVRLSDSNETKMLSLFSNSKNSLFKSIVKMIISKRAVSMGIKNPCLLIMCFDDYEYLVSSRTIPNLISKYKAMVLPSSTSKNWESKRFSLPYFRDVLVRYGFLIDTFETVSYWSHLKGLYSSIYKGLEKQGYFNSGGLLFAHVSHTYMNGASLYFTLLTPQTKGNELQQWEEIKSCVSRIIIDNNGAISHHHGVGKDHAPWFEKSIGPDNMGFLKGVKKLLDPSNILNPGSFYGEGN